MPWGEAAAWCEPALLGETPRSSRSRANSRPGILGFPACYYGVFLSHGSVFFLVGADVVVTNISVQRIRR